MIWLRLAYERIRHRWLLRQLRRFYPDRIVWEIDNDCKEEAERILKER